MTYQVIAPFIVKTSEGVLAFSQGQIIKLKVDKAAVLLQAGKIKKQQDDINPFPSDWLKRFDEDVLERLAIMTVDDGMSDEDAERAIVDPETVVKSSWPPETQSLIDWFMKLKPPAESFYLEPHMRVLDPSQFFDALRHEIKTGTTGPRARMGTLQSDLRKLKAYLN